mmetsp:Transcript_44895/g.106544  ORF Transcript_44895/g.106544 Transcript_44895/m.106544 type:complete len:357 (-) Transcript_44895:245-1315(-)
MAACCDQIGRHHPQQQQHLAPSCGLGCSPAIISPEPTSQTASSPGCKESSEAAAGDAWLAQVQSKLGFKEAHAFYAWLVLAALMVLFSVVRLGLVHPEKMEKMMAPGEFYLHRNRKLRLVVHVASAVGWAILGLVQFLPRVRAVALGYHKWVGRVYIILCATVAVSGLLMSSYSFGGEWSAQAALWTIFFCFSGSAVLGVIRIRQGLVQEHRAWMLRNYASGASVLWCRLTVGVAAALSRLLSEQWGVMHCDQVLYELRDESYNVLKENFADCLTNPAARTIVSTKQQETIVNTIVSMRMSFGFGMWLGLFINLCAVEIWIRRTRTPTQQKSPVYEQPAAPGDGCPEAADGIIQII